MSREDKSTIISGQRDTINSCKSFLRTTNNNLNYKLKQLQTLKESLTTLFKEFFDCFDDQVNKTIDSTSSRIKVQKRIGNAQTIDRSYKEIHEVIRKNNERLVPLEKVNGINQEKIAKEISEYVNELNENEYVKESSAIVYEKYETLLNDLIQIIEDLRKDVILKQPKKVDIEELCIYFRETQQKLTDIFKQEGIAHIKKSLTIVHHDPKLDILPQIYIHIPCDVVIDAQLFDSLKKQLVDIIGNDFVLADVKRGSIFLKLMLIRKIAKEYVKNVIADIKEIPLKVKEILEKVRGHEFSIITSTKNVKSKADYVINEPPKPEELKKYLEREVKLEDMNLMGVSKNTFNEDIINKCIDHVEDVAIKQEISTQISIAEGIKEEMEEFERKLEEAQRNSIFEFKVNKIAFIDKEKRENYKVAKRNCPNLKSKVLFHGSNVDACSKIVCGDFKEPTNDGKYGKGVYFTDSLDYLTRYATISNGQYTFVQTEVFYDSSKKKRFYDDQYVKWLQLNGKIDNDKNFRKFRNGKKTKENTEENEIRKGKVGKEGWLCLKESKEKPIVFNEFIVRNNNQYLPLATITVERSEYLIIWRDPNFIKGGCGYIKQDSKKFYEYLHFCKEYIPAHSGYNLYCEPTTEGAIELIKRKKHNKIILISNIGDDFGGKSFVEEARKILGSNVIVLFNAYQVSHLNWVKDYPNALFSNKQEFFEEFIGNFNETGLKSLKNEIEKHYNVQFKQFDDEFLNYPCFIKDGRYDSIKDVNNHETLLPKRISEKYSKLLGNLDVNEMKQIESWTGMKIRNVIFDSKSDNWNIRTSLFDETIIYRSNLIFIIEDENANKFGGYNNAKIDDYNTYINAPKSFLISLKSNGRLNGMLKFEINEPQNGFILCPQSDDNLFAIGYDIFICKKHKKNECYCYQQSFNYKGIENSLCGKSYPNTFKPKRITVIQLK